MKNYYDYFISKLGSINTKTRKHILRFTKIGKIINYYKYNYAIPKKYEKIKNSLKKKDKITVFLMMNSVDLWKLDSVYESLNKSVLFEPYIVIAPIIKRGKKFAIKHLKSCNTYCLNKKYRFLVGIDDNLDYNKTLERTKADIVIYTNPNNLSHDKINYNSKNNTLPCYIPYSVRIDKLFKYSYDNDFTNSMWMNFVESNFHLSLAKKHSSNKGINYITTGHPQLDYFKKNKLKSKKIGKTVVIWAPHWTLPNLKLNKKTVLGWGTFHLYYKKFIELAKKYNNEIEIVIKPHPFLFDAMNKSTNYGYNFVDNFKTEWLSLSNCSIYENDYKNLFIESDALIHDSGSFAVEYLQLNKPAAYLYDKCSTVSINERFNSYGKQAVDTHSIIDSNDSLEQFINNVLDHKDSKENDRKKFITNNLNGKLAASNIVSYLEEQLS